jgi:DNA-binding response OmpR family regulator
MRVVTSANVGRLLESSHRLNAVEAPPEMRRVANVTLYPQLAAVTVSGTPLPFSPKEFALLKTLFEEPSTVVSRERCRTALGGITGWKSERLLSVFIYALRMKLRAAGAGVEVATVRGRGYVLRAR